MSTKICVIEGCEKDVSAKGYCGMHYVRIKRIGSPGSPIGRDYSLIKTCTIEGCEKPYSGNGMCNTHYQRWFRKGDPGSPDLNRPRGEAHHRWAGDEITYYGAHHRLSAIRGRADQFFCVDCGGDAASWAYDHVDPSELTDDRGIRYSGDPDHYEPKCNPCHKIGDLAHLALTS